MMPRLSRRDFAAATAVGIASRGEISLELRRRGADGEPLRSRVALSPKALTAVVVDAWTAHTCSGFTEAAAAFLPGINRTLTATRLLGIPIVFASSGDDLKRWEGKPQRLDILNLRMHPLPPSNGFLAGHRGNGPFTVPCMCRITRLAETGRDPVFDCRKIQSDHRQHPAIEVGERDLFIAAGHYRPGTKSAVRSWGEPAQQELWNFVRERGITTLLYIGFATNMCVINREFAMIQMKRLGIEAVLVRDLTLSITYNGYNPMTRELDPAFTPAVGTRYAVEYIEERIGPSIESRQLLRAAGL